MERLAELHREKYDCYPDTIAALRSDGSDREIYRLFSGENTIIGILGKDVEENKAFLNFSRHFRQADLKVPEIFIENAEKNAYLEEDLGDYTLFQWMMEIRKKHGFTNDVKNMYKKVIEYLPNFQIKAGTSIDYSYCYQHHEFGQVSMNWDLHYFQHRFIEPFYHCTLNRWGLENDFQTLINFLLEENREYFLYRDFQSRNVMIKNNEPYFIDYQSGRLGALQYDVASLLYDAKADLPESFRKEMIDVYLKNIQIFKSIDQTRFMNYFYGFVLIRIMQAFGAYGFLSVVKKKKHFFRSVPFAIQNLKTLLESDLEIFNMLPTLKEIYQNLITDESLTKFESDDE